MICKVGIRKLKFCVPPLKSISIYLFILIQNAFCRCPPPLLVHMVHNSVCPLCDMYSRQWHAQVKRLDPLPCNERWYLQPQLFREFQVPLPDLGSGGSAQACLRCRRLLWHIPSRSFLSQVVSKHRTTQESPPEMLVWESGVGGEKRGRDPDSPNSRLHTHYRVK